MHRTMLPILVIGGGISGVTSAVELAEAGREVILLERSPYLGGNVVKMHNYFPKLCPPACGMEINYRRIRNNRRIRLITHAEVKSIEGSRGNMQVEVAISPQMVNDLCTSCGDCTAECPVERSDTFNFNMGTTKAICLPHPLAFPQKYDIDAAACTGASCGKCAEVCSYGAIDLAAGAGQETLAVHSVIVATGWTSYDAAQIEGLAYGKSPDIVTNVEFERLLSVTGPDGGSLKRPSDGTSPASVAFVQCAGSRDRNHLPYCSAVCCSASLKHALNVAELLPKAKVTIFYIDLRVTGRNEDFLKRVEQCGTITLVKGKVARVEPRGEDGALAVVAEDIASGRKVHESFDMVVLATGIVPSNGLPGLHRNEEGFCSTVQEDGIYAAACAKKPMDVSASVKDATAAALKAMKI
jgi:quinone-modifying oxidoreductase, subunit QmoA